MSTIELALDWTPNTNHSGIYVAKANGYYDDVELDVRIRSPATDSYDETPAKRVATGDSTIAIAPSESAISYHTHPDYDSLTAIAAVCQQDTSAIVALGDSDINRPADLDGKSYASYDARFEDHIVEQLVRNDGGDGTLDITTPPKLGIWNTLVEGEADATWVFMPWEGVMAKRDGIELTPFYLDEYGVPYGYTPLMLAREDTITKRADALERFLDATGRGYEFATDNPADAARILGETATGPDSLDDEAFLVESQNHLTGNYLTDDGMWGRMNSERWEQFVEWLADEEILTTVDGDHIHASEIDVSTLYTNELLP
ncbi:ABC transporter substrate-binding protein [Halovenus rubra]|uniref:Thiamine pyrimidine synthase n=2 Tax=Halovenus rubra TaxID=869890 RepID=A0ABD5X7Z9_9EURY|nr:ABC transporter substrate-binding protein [Halovenus rubra]